MTSACSLSLICMRGFRRWAGKSAASQHNGAVGTTDVTRLPRIDIHGRRSHRRRKLLEWRDPADQKGSLISWITAPVNSRHFGTPSISPFWMLRTVISPFQVGAKRMLHSHFWRLHCSYHFLLQGSLLYKGVVHLHIMTLLSHKSPPPCTSQGEFVKYSPVEILPFHCDLHKSVLYCLIARHLILLKYLCFLFWCVFYLV